MEQTIPPRVLELLEWPLVSDELRKRCATVPGAGEIALLRPLDPAGARSRLRKITEMKEMMQQAEALDFAGITDIAPLVEMADKGGVLSLEQLAEIRDFCRASHSIRRTLKEQGERFPDLGEEHDRLDDLAKLRGLLNESITERNDLNPERYPELRRIAAELFAAREELERTMRGIINSPRLEQALQEKVFTTRNDRCVLLVKTAMKDRIRGTVHDVSASGATCYIEPEEITPLNNRVRMLEGELRGERQRILRTLSGKAAESGPPLTANLGVIAMLDFLSAAALFSIDTGGSEPVIEEEPVIELFRARHPLLHLMSPGTTVANDISLGAHRCMIISGANTGGKTVVLKTIGLCALFAMLGLHVTAGPDSRIGLFSRILADIGDDQSLSRSLSTFSGQIVAIDEMLAAADDTSLVIIDEIIVGTDPAQGAALARAILESLIETGGTIVVTTHYSMLKELPPADPRFINASVSFDMDTLRPTYRLITGLPGVSYALEIAEIYGLPTGMISRARSLLDEREIGIDALIEKVQRFEREMSEERARLDEHSQRLAGEKERIDGLMKTLERRTQEIREKEGIEFLEELKEYRRLVSERITDLQRMGQKDAARANAQLRVIEASIRSALEGGREKLYLHRYRPAEPESIRPGDRLFIMSLEKEGTVERVDPAKNEAVLLLGSSMRTTRGFDDLYRPHGAPAAPVPRKVKKRTGIRTEAPAQNDGEIPPALQTSFNTIDLRGKRVDEGIDAMERDFDRMIRGGIDTAVVIHGHGTGAMKSAVRSHLTRCRYAGAFRPGKEGEGGDGVTIVRLDI
ncbi:MAG: Smr/MutS family protein [Spirochaetes bacterium]|nr:Smr/MutS family protein [Spirochaetota bacterium]